VGNRLKGGGASLKPVGPDPTKPREAAASVQQLLPGCNTATGRIAGAGVVAVGYGRYGVSKFGFISSIREVARSLPPIESKAVDQTELICPYRSSPEFIFICLLVSP